MLSRSIIVPGTLLALVAVAAVARDGSGGQADTAVEMLARVPRQGDLRVLVWNVQRGANGFTRGPEKTLAVVRSVQPDVVLLQESYDIDGGRPTLGRWLATELGWKAWQGGSRHLCVLTRFEIEETFFHHDWHGVGARIVDDRGRALVVYSIWIDSAVYMPYHLRDEPDVSDESLLKDEAERSGRGCDRQRRSSNTWTLRATWRPTCRCSSAVTGTLHHTWIGPSTRRRSSGSVGRSTFR